MTVKKTGKDTYLSQVIELVKNAQESRSKTQNLANRAAFVLTVVALAVGSLTFAAWLIYGREFAFAIRTGFFSWLHLLKAELSILPHPLNPALPAPAHLLLPDGGSLLQLFNDVPAPGKGRLPVGCRADYGHDDLPHREEAGAVHHIN